MSIHHLSNAGMLDMPAAKKLVFMAICDDASNDNGHAFPGIDKLMAWSGVRKSRVLELVAELVGDGYLTRVSAGHRGARAVFQVYSRIACCALHEPFEEGSGTVDPNKGSAVPDPNDQKGSDKGSDKGSASYRTPPVSSVSPEKKPAQQRGTRLPDGWKPSQELWDQFASERPDLDLELEHDNFTDYWVAKAGRDGSKLDWSATWRRWMRSARPNRIRYSQRASGEDRGWWEAP